MKTVGIIAEYNPYHNGHFYQMAQARRLFGADYVVVIMSPDFVQRGEPALLDKWTRAQMALDAGADLILELPVRYATGSAEYFAYGAISTLSSLGVVDALSFGCESAGAGSGKDSTDTLLSYARFLSGKEPEGYRAMMKEYLKNGVSFAEARCKAYLSYTGQKDPDKLLKSPNNILAIEYMKAILQTGSDMSIVPVRRIGAGYHDITVSRADSDEGSYTVSGSDAGTGTGTRLYNASKSDAGERSHTVSDPDYVCASAAGIRSALMRGEGIQNLMPAKARKLLEEEMSLHRFLFPSDLDLPLHLALYERRASLTEYIDVSEALANRIDHLLPRYLGFDQFTELLKTRQLAYTRIRRALLHILLGLKDSPSKGKLPFARVLGFHKNAAPLLHAIKEKGTIPLVTKLPPRATVTDMFEEDLNATQLWELIVSHKTGAPVRNERQRQILIL